MHRERGRGEEARYDGEKSPRIVADSPRTVLAWIAAPREECRRDGVRDDRDDESDEEEKQQPLYFI